MGLPAFWERKHSSLVSPALGPSSEVSTRRGQRYADHERPRSQPPGRGPTTRIPGPQLSEQELTTRGEGGCSGSHVQQNQVRPTGPLPCYTLHGFCLHFCLTHACVSLSMHRHRSGPFENINSFNHHHNPAKQAFYRLEN